jgi:hypothetical protein
MLILPIVNRNRILNVKIELKDAEKVKRNVYLENTAESDVIVNGQEYSKSSLAKDDNSVVDFIRYHSIHRHDDYFVTTRSIQDSTLYDIYKVHEPPAKVNKELDGLYNSVVTDMRKEIPNMINSRYISFEKLGIGEHLTDEKINKLQRIVREVPDQSKWPELFQEAGIADLPKTIDFVNNFNCTVIKDTTIPEDIMQGVIASLEPMNGKDAKELRKHYEMALENREIYSKLSYINKALYDKPFDLIHSEATHQKQYVKVNDERDRAA